MLDDDPLFEEIRAARPQAPASFERAVLARLDRPRRLPLVIGGSVAIAATAATVCIVILVRPGHRDDPRVVRAVDAAAAIPQPDRPAVPVVPPQRPDPIPHAANWDELDTIWSEIETHRAAIDACGGTGAITINIRRQRDGRAVASHPLYGIGYRGPTPRELCRVAAISAIVLPALPSGLRSIQLGFSIATKASSAAAWSAPLALIRTELGQLALGSCVFTKTAKITVVVDRTQHANPRIWLPRWQFSTEKANGAEKIACMAKQFAKAKLPELPPLIGEIQVELEVVK